MRHPLAPCLLLLAVATSLPGQRQRDIVGRYERLPTENDWHTGQIVAKGRTLEWQNDAGVRWSLELDRARKVLRTGPGNPYAKNGNDAFVLLIRGGKVVAFEFGGETYRREGVTLLTQRSGGLKGYISMTVPRPPKAFGYGASFYAAVWSLVERPLAGFQIGLPSTWIIPSNRDFKQALVPPGTRAHAWKERAPIYHDVFQTIEGGLGYWVSTQFGAAVPKYRMNGTPNGYDHEISSPGWGFGKTEPLRPEQTGIAQLSNRLLVPPDGLTFGQVRDGDLLGNAWMALPLVPARTDPVVSTGDQSWTLFLRAKNFNGALAFFVPDTWSRLSRRYKPIVGRGLDARPGEMGSGAMEVNTVPFFETRDAQGVVHTKVPRLQFPVDRDGLTVLMQDITLYSKAALFEAVRDGAGGGALPRAFATEGAWQPDCRPRPITFRQGGENVPLVGFDGTVETTTFGEGSKNAFGLRWKNARGTGTLPAYYRADGRRRVAIPPRDAPQELRAAAFREARDRSSYAPPPAVGDATTQVQLRDGSVIGYAWYRFVEQPVIRAQGWDARTCQRVQGLVERIHAAWGDDRVGMPPPTRGTLVTLDPALLVTPPPGKERGWVPVVLFQRRPGRPR